MAASHIQGKEYQIKDIFCKNFEFIIPRYQRPYAWGLEQAQTLLEDLISALGDLDDDGDDVESYFLGSIVLVKDEYKERAEVVDGQQRLTTLTILLAVLRSLYGNTASLNKYIYEPADDIENREEHFHLTLRARDAEFFREYIQRDEKLEKIRKLNVESLTDSQKQMVTNAMKFVEILGKLSHHQIMKILKYLVNQCYLIAVTTPNVESAYRIFSILNDRGLDLSHSDIIKAEIIGKIDLLDQDPYTAKWEEAEEEIGRDGFKDLFAHIRMIHRKMKYKETILKELRTYVIPQYQPKAFVDEVVVPLSEAYAAIRTSGYLSKNLAEEINGVFEWLGRIDNIDWLPPAMAYYNSFKHDPNCLLKFFVDLERLAASLMIRRENVNIRIARYGQLLDWIEKNDDLFGETSPLQLSPDEKRSTVDRINGDVYNSGARIYILRRLDAALSEMNTTPNLHVYTVEHVLPQNPATNSQWLEWYPDENQRNVWVHRLGNLALLSRQKNSQAKNYEFDKKKQLYFNSPLTPFALTMQVIRQTEWTPSVIHQMQKQNVGMLTKLWRLE